ncbi:hypothetical protein K502DRAFT_353689 [Neoconidiobolus thromboides FSU 785]|nr:hypothetical protein K502DRAFT_353689 [Neoconidiobolus thromboides FSU 785]
MCYGNNFIAKQEHKPENLTSVLFQLFEELYRLDTFTYVALMKQKEDKVSKLQGEILFNNIVFSYPTRFDIIRLNVLNSRVDISTIMVLVRPLGSSKSSVIGLIEGFYDENSGSITIAALNNATENLTIISIARCLSTIGDLDEILVFNNGEIEEEGNHEELLKEGGIYVALFEL